MVEAQAFMVARTSVAVGNQAVSMGAVGIPAVDIAAAGTTDNCGLSSGD
jgi:hypothetical protein